MRKDRQEEQQHRMDLHLCRNADSVLGGCFHRKKRMKGGGTNNHTYNPTYMHTPPSPQ